MYYGETLNELVADISCVEMVAVADELLVPRRPKTQIFTGPPLSATEYADAVRLRVSTEM